MTMKEVNAQSDGVYSPGPLVHAMKTVKFPSIQYTSGIKIAADGELDVPYYLYNFRKYQSSSNCPPGETCNECESEGGTDCQLYEGWQMVGMLVNGTTLEMKGPRPSL